MRHKTVMCCYNEPEAFWRVHFAGVNGATSITLYTHINDENTVELDRTIARFAPHTARPPLKARVTEISRDNGTGEFPAETSLFVHRLRPRATAVDQHAGSWGAFFAGTSAVPGFYDLARHVDPRWTHGDGPRIDRAERYRRARRTIEEWAIPPGSIVHLGSDSRPEYGYYVALGGGKWTYVYRGLVEAADVVRAKYPDAPIGRMIRDGLWDPVLDADEQATAFD